MNTFFYWVCYIYITLFLRTANKLLFVQVIIRFWTSFVRKFCTNFAHWRRVLRCLWNPDSVKLCDTVKIQFDLILSTTKYYFSVWCILPIIHKSIHPSIHLSIYLCKSFKTGQYQFPLVQISFFQDEFRRIDFGMNYNMAKVAKEYNVPLYSLVSTQGAHSQSYFLYLQSKGEVKSFSIILRNSLKSLNLVCFLNSIWWKNHPLSSTVYFLDSF